MFKQIASNTLSQVSSKVATAVISIFLLSILTNYLSVEMFGLYGKVYNYVGLFVFLADLWLYTIAIREITANKSNTQKIVGNIMTLRWILWIMILFFALWIAYFLPWYNSDIALWAIFFGSLFTIFQLFNSSIMSLMQANMKMEFSLFSTVAGKLINVGIVALIAFVWFVDRAGDSMLPFIGIIIASLVGVIINTVLNFWYWNRIAPIRFLFDWSYILSLFKVSLPYGIALFLSVVYFKVDVILLWLMEWPWAWDISIALYSLPMKIVEVVMVMGWFYLNSILPFLSSGFEKKDYSGLQVLLKNSLQILFGASVWMCVLGILFREHIVELIANDNYITTSHIFSSVDVFPIVLWVIVFYFISLLYIYVLVAAKKQSQLLKINIFVTLINIIWNILLIPHFSFMGAAVMTLVSQIILLILTIFSARKLVPFEVPILSLVKTGGLWCGIYIVGYMLLSDYSLWFYGDILLYGGLLWAWYTGIWYLMNKKTFFTQK